MAYYIAESGYLNLLQDTLKYGEHRPSRNGDVISRFGCIVNFENIQERFPLLTTKRIFFRGVVEELLWFLRGSTDATELQAKDVHIWDGNSTREYLDSIGLTEYKEGELGPVYGWQWRHFGAQYPEPLSGQPKDQLKYLIEELLKEDNSRRAVLSAWNPVDLPKMALPPCHILYIFYKNSKGLSCHMTMRSSDLFLGLPFNIASTALLTFIIAKVLHIPASKITLSLADAHIYEEHIDAVNTQTSRELYEAPSLEIQKDAPSLESSIDEKIEWIESLTFNDFKLNNYMYNAPIKAPMK